MKPRHCQIFLFLAFFALFAANAAERRISIEKEAFHTLDRDTYIVIAENASKVLRFAASEMQTHLGKVLDAKLSVKHELSGSGTALILGDGSHAKAAGIESASFDRDGFRILSVGKNIIIAGRDDPNADPARLASHYFEMASLFGTYDFLERIAGVRFYFPGDSGVVAPLRKIIQVGKIDIYDRPDHIQRRTRTGRCVMYEGEEYRSGNMLQQYRNRIQTHYIPNCHSLERLGLYERFAETNPEYFAVDKYGKQSSLDRAQLTYGTPCFSSSGFRNEVYLDAASYLKKEAASVRGVLMRGKDSGWDPSCCRPGFFNVMPGDYHIQCRCEKCRLYEQEHGEGEIVWDMVREVASRIQQAGIPGKITAMSYAYYNIVPKCELPENVEVMVCVTGPWGDREKSLREKDEQKIEQWNAKLGRKVWLWTYPSKYKMPALRGIPCMAPRCVGEYYRRVAGKVFGSFMECETDFWIFQYLNMYVYSKVSWDNLADVDDIIAEHHRLMFGPAEAPMTEFFNTMENTWCEKLLGKQTMTALGPVNVPPGELEIFNRIYGPEELARLNALFDSAEKLAENEAEPLERVRFMRKHLFNPVQMAAEKYRRDHDFLKNWTACITAIGPEERPTVDGSLNEAIWGNCEKLYLLPKNGDPEVTSFFQFAHDKDFLYVAATCMEPAMEGLVALRTENHDPDIWRDSEVEVILNPSDDASTYFQWMINANAAFAANQGKKLGGRSVLTANKSSAAIVKTIKSADRWTMEMAIPKEELGPIEEKGFRANCGRHRVVSPAAKTKIYSWSPVGAGFHDLEKFGRLVFQKGNENLVKNGDFSADTLRGSWTSSPGAEGLIEFDTTHYISGGKSIRLSGNGTVRLTQPLKELKPESAYSVSFFIRTENIVPHKKSGGVYINLGDNKNDFRPPRGYTGSMPWTSQNFLWKTGATTNLLPGRNACIIFLLRNASGTVWLDRVSITEIKE